MPTPEQQSRQEEQRQSLDGMPEPQEQAEQHFKTIAVRVHEGLHAQLSFIAQLTGKSLSDEIRRAIEGRIASAQDDPDLIARAQMAREQIEREAAARTAAIAGFMGGKATAAATGAAAQASPRVRRPTKTSDK